MAQPMQGDGRDGHLIGFGTWPVGIVLMLKDPGTIFDIEEPHIAAP